MTPALGLRQRKKLAAMKRIQEVALDLFDQRGFANVTIEEIAEAADVSPSSVYRYFGSKEQLVLRDEFEPQFFDKMEAELASQPPVEALRRTVAWAMAEFLDRDDEVARRRTKYSLEEPALRAAFLEQTDTFSDAVAASLARAVRRDPNDLEVRVIAAAIVWSLQAAIGCWHAGGQVEPLREQLDKALAILENGLLIER